MTRSRHLASFLVLVAACRVEAPPDEPAIAGGGAAGSAGAATTGAGGATAGATSTGGSAGSAGGGGTDASGSGGGPSSTLGSPCAGLPGFGVPAGTVASEDAPDQPTNTPNEPPSNAIDCSAGTDWNAGAPAGELRLSFPAPTHIAVVHIATGAKPTANETFTIRSGGTVVGQVQQSVPFGVQPVLVDIDIRAGDFTELSIAVDASPSFAYISECTLDAEPGPWNCGDGNCDWPRGEMCATCPADCTLSTGQCLPVGAKCAYAWQCETNRGTSDGLCEPCSTVDDCPIPLRCVASACVR